MTTENGTDARRSRQRIAEYALIVSFTVIAALVVLILLGTHVGDVLALIADTIHD